MQRSPMRRAGALVGGGLVLLVGVVLLVLPGPGLLLVLAGLVILSTQFPAVERYVDPVRERAMKAMAQSVASPWRIAGSTVAGLALIGVGVVWWIVPTLPLGGWPTGSSFVLSGLVVLVLLAWSYRRVRQQNTPAGR